MAMEFICNLQIKKCILKSELLHRNRNMLSWRYLAESNCENILMEGVAAAGMELILEQISEGDEAVIVRYHHMTEQIEVIKEIVEGTEPKIHASWEGQIMLLRPEYIYYLETVDGVTYAYLEDKVARVSESLRALSVCFGKRGFFRCSKSMILNICKIRYLKSEPCNRIRATMENGEQVMISRKYAKELRQILKGGASDVE